jgi:hypothetical protein
MTLDDLSLTLPNGFHDAQLRELTFDFPKKEVRLLVDLWVGDLHSKEHAVRERYQSAQLFLEDLGFWISGPTDPKEFPIGRDSLCIDIRLLPDDYIPGVSLPEPSPDKPTYYLYSTDINTCFFFSCGSAKLQWSQPGA